MNEDEHARATDDPNHPHNAPLSDVQLRVRALESLLVDKGLVDPTAMDELVDTYETRVGPRNGAQVVEPSRTTAIETSRRGDELQLHLKFHLIREGESIDTQRHEPELDAKLAAAYFTYCTYASV